MKNIGPSKVRFTQKQVYNPCLKDREKSSRRKAQGFLIENKNEPFLGASTYFPKVLSFFSGQNRHNF